MAWYLLALYSVYHLAKGQPSIWSVQALIYVALFSRPPCTVLHSSNLYTMIWLHAIQVV